MTSFFKRYADGGTSDRHIHMPQRLSPTTVSHCPLEVLVGHWEKYVVDPSSVREQFPWSARFVMGMPVPAWARGVEWNLGQKSRFISAVWSGGDLGSYITNDWYEPEIAGRALAENSEILVDGQQRLHSLEEYFLDRLAVPDAQGQQRIWSELGNGERKRFLSTIFTHMRVSSGEIPLNYTSGTIGNPKGMVYHHRGVYLNALGNQISWAMGIQPVYLWTLPMFHCNGWCYP